MRNLDLTLPNFRHLRAFREVARTGSITRAVDRIHLSQPAITQALAKLEECVGAPLFERQSGGMHPTEAGNHYLDRVTRALELVRNGAREANRLGARKGTRGFSDFDRHLTTPQLKALVAVAGAGSFSLAARQAGVSQPTLHRAARDVERLSGLSLFMKTPRGIELTPAADVLIRSIKLALAELAQGYTEIGELQGGDSGQIVVGTLPLPRVTILPKAINALLATRPDARISVVDGPYDDLLKALRHGELDILTGALRTPTPAEDVVQEALFSDPLAVVGRVGHPLAEQDAITTEDLARFPWVVPREGTPTRSFFDRMFKEIGIPGGLIETSSLLLIRSLLMGSDRLTLISAHQVRDEEDFGLLRRLPVGITETSRPIGVTHRRDWRPTNTQRAFLDCLRAAGKAAASA